MDTFFHQLNTYFGMLLWVRIQGPYGWYHVPLEIKILHCVRSCEYLSSLCCWIWAQTIFPNVPTFPNKLLRSTQANMLICFKVDNLWLKQLTVEKFNCIEIYSVFFQLFSRREATGFCRRFRTNHHLEKILKTFLQKSRKHVHLLWSPYP